MLVVGTVIAVVLAFSAGLLVKVKSRRWCQRCGTALECFHCLAKVERV